MLSKLVLTGFAFKVTFIFRYILINLLTKFQEFTNQLHRDYFF